MSKVLIVAYEIQHVEYYAREVLRVGRSSWKLRKLGELIIKMVKLP